MTTLPERTSDESPQTQQKWLGYFDLSKPADLGKLTGCFVVFHVLLWLILTTFTHRAPHWDNMEEIVWAQSFQWGYYKHPPFSTWVYTFWTSLLGQHFWVTYFSSLFNIGLMLLIMWRIALMVMNPARALMAVVLSAIIFYHSVHGIISDQNTLQLMPIALMAWLLLLSVRVGGWWRWALMGLAAAICVLTKYSAVVWFAVMGLWLIQDKRMRDWRVWCLVLLSVLTCVLALWPHIDWLIRENYPTFQYAEYQAGGRGVSENWRKLGGFLSAQAGRIVPLLLAVGIVRYHLRKEPVVAQVAVFDEPTRAEWRFVDILALGPMVLAILLGMAGVNLNANWAVTFFILTGVWAVKFLPKVQTTRLLKTVLAVGIALDIAMAVGEALSGGVVVDLMKRQSRANFPAAQYAELLDKAWAEHMGADTPVALVVADEWFGGTYLVKSKYKPLVFLDGYYSETPWIKPDMLKNCGALMIVDRREDSPPPRPNVIALLEKASWRGSFEIPWTRTGKGEQLQIEWAIIEPQVKGACKPSP